MIGKCKEYIVIYVSIKNGLDKFQYVSIVAEDKGQAKEIFYQNLPLDFDKFVKVVR